MCEYYDSADGVLLSRKRVLKELKIHHIDCDDDIRDFDTHVKPNAKGIYWAQDVLQWLGY